MSKCKYMIWCSIVKCFFYVGQESPVSLFIAKFQMDVLEINCMLIAFRLFIFSHLSKSMDTLLFGYFPSLLKI